MIISDFRLLLGLVKSPSKLGDFTGYSLIENSSRLSK